MRILSGLFPKKICARCGIDLGLPKRAEKSIRDGKWYCDACAKVLAEKRAEGLFPCADCGRMFAKTELKQVYGRSYCPDCVRWFSSGPDACELPERILLYKNPNGPARTSVVELESLILRRAQDKLFVDWVVGWRGGFSHADGAGASDELPADVAGRLTAEGLCGFIRQIHENYREFDLITEALLLQNDEFRQFAEAWNAMPGEERGRQTPAGTACKVKMGPIPVATKTGKTIHQECRPLGQQAKDGFRFKQSILRKSADGTCYLLFRSGISLPNSATVNCWHMQIDERAAKLPDAKLLAMCRDCFDATLKEKPVDILKLHFSGHPSGHGDQIELILKSDGAIAVAVHNDGWPNPGASGGHARTLPDEITAHYSYAALVDWIRANFWSAGNPVEIDRDDPKLATEQEIRSFFENRPLQC